MRLKNHFVISLFIIASSLVFGQETVLCSLQTDIFKIENSDNIPTVTDNGDGTITLTQQDQVITDIFSQYIIYDFYQSYPNSNPEGELIKYFTIVHGNKALISELRDYAHPQTFLVNDYVNTTISPLLIDLLDNKTYKLVKYCTWSTEGGLPCPEGELYIPEEFELKIAFEYDTVNDIIYAETVDVSSCGNSFSIGMKGGFDDGFGSTDNTLQLWESEPGISTLTDYSQPCHNIENMLYSVLDVSCSEGNNYGNIRVNTDNGEEGQFVLERENALFATDFLTFQDNALSIDENSFNSIRLFQTKGNPYLQISNLNNQIITVEIYSTSGQLIKQTKTFEENNLDISNLTTGLYFIKLSNLNNQQKIFKFLKN